jgi:glycosyltransferase involved in cell wall biosynthesis
MTIALLTDKLSVGGGLEYIYQVARGMPEYRFVVCARGGDERARLAKLPNVTIDASGYGPSTVARHAPSIIHFNHVRPLVTHLYCRRRSSLPLINGVHGVHLRKFQFHSGPLNATIAATRRSVERHCISKVDITIAETASDKSLLEQLLGAKNVAIIPNGIDISEPPRSATPEWNDNAAIRFVTIARFDFQKGHDILLGAIVLTQEKLRSARCNFYLVGDGPLKPKMEKLVDTLNIRDLVRFCGSSHGLHQPLSSADCLIMPSRWEGMPFVLLEAGRYGKDAICSNFAGSMEITDSARCALIFENGNIYSLSSAISRYLNGEGRDLGSKLQKHIFDHYSRDAMIARLRSVYQHFAS